MSPPQSPSHDASCRPACPIRAGLGADRRSLHPSRRPNPHSAPRRRVPTLSRVPSLEASVRRPPCARMALRRADIRNPSQERSSRNTDHQTTCAFEVRHPLDRRLNFAAPQSVRRAFRKENGRSWVSTARRCPHRPQAASGRGFRELMSSLIDSLATLNGELRSSIGDELDQGACKTASTQNTCVVTVVAPNFCCSVFGGEAAMAER